MAELQVRLADSADVNTLISLVHEYHTEEGSSVLSFDDSAVFDVILEAMRGNAIIGVIGSHDEIQSVCFMKVAKPWYSQSGLIDSLLVYSTPEHRKSDNTKKLLSWMRSQSERLGCPLQVDVPITEDNQPKLALCKRILGEPAGLSWTYKPNPEAPTEAPEPTVEPATLADENEIRAIAKEIADEISHFPIDPDMA